MIDESSPSLEPPGAVRRLQAAQLRLAAVALMTMMTGTVLDVFFRYASTSRCGSPTISSRACS